MKDGLPTDDPFRGKSAAHHMVFGSLWMVTMRWAMRVVGVISTAVLARLLSPSDFGHVAIAMVTVAVVEILIDSGLRQALIRHPNPIRAHYDTAWTMNILIGIGIFVMLWFLAPLGAAYFEAPEAEILIRILGIRGLLFGLQNIGIADFHRHLEYHKDFKMNVAAKVAGAIVGIVAAFILRNYWALVIAVFASVLVQLVLSYTMSPYRPRLSLAKARELWGFSFWMIGVNYALLLMQKMDELIVGRIGNVHQMGFYSVGNDVATFATMELIYPLTRSLFPVYSKLVDQPAVLAQRFRQAFAVMVSAAFSCGIGFALVSRDFTLVVLGDQWTGLISLLPFLSMAGALQILAYSSSVVLQAMGKPRITTIQQWFVITLMVVIMPAAGMRYGIEGIAASRLAIMVVFVPLCLFVITRELPLTMCDLLGEMWRPVLASAAMAGVLVYVVPSDWVDIPAIRLVADITVGAMVYGGVSLLLWQLAGRPPGIESFVLKVIRTRRLTLVDDPAT